MSELSDLEDDVARTRERLNLTINRIQDKLTLSGIVDEVMGQTAIPTLAARRTNFVGTALDRYPVPLMIAAAGLGFAIFATRRREEARAKREAREVSLGHLDVGQPARNPSRAYDPDRPSSQSPIG